MSKIEGEKPKIIAALTADQVNWSLFTLAYYQNRKEDPENPFDYSNDIRKFYTDPNAFAAGEFVDEAKKMIQSEWQRKRVRVLVLHTEELRSFLEQHRPKILFFDPQDIESHLMPDSNVIVGHNKSNKSEEWVFKLNPQKYPTETESLKLYRGVRKTSAPYPYFPVQYFARYDGANIVFNPRIFHPGQYAPHVEKELLNLMGVESVAVKQQLNFEFSKGQHVFTARIALPSS